MMRFDELSAQLDKLYSTSNFRSALTIYPYIRFDSESICFHLILEEDRYTRISTDDAFAEWMAYVTTDGYRHASPQIRKIAQRFGVQWDQENGYLFIRFRRNEMSLAQAVLRLEQATLVVGSLNYRIEQE